ncbi:MAG: tRNA uridine-5-carboxymethylaminomethyl(34) synthesis GTPase MnmE [Limisphaerales bacterium]
MLQDTIAAVSTPIGESGLAVVRLSGAEALRISDRCFKPIGASSVRPTEAATHTVHYGKMHRAGKVIDEVLLTVLRAPRTFTREDMVEISCHGGVLPAKLVLDALLEGGARLAEAGEFTKRAFLNGRIDLTQAEAVADLIHSRTELALDAANEQLAGKLSRRIEDLRNQMVQTLAHIEAHIDFPDEDISPDTKDQLVKRLEGGVAFMDELLATANEGQILRRGIRAAIIGRPNAGKSSLLNQLLGHERAIVSPIPGTTRDTIEETANIRGIPVIFVDTAGIRESTDTIEAEGIRRSRQSQARAELVLEVIDASEPLTHGGQLTPADNGKKHLIILNKIDLPQKTTLATETHKISCSTGEGLEALKDAIRDAVWSGRVSGEMHQVMINARHQEALQRAKRHTVHTIEALRSNQTLELAAMDLRIATNAIGEIVGKTTTEDILDSIFSQFCIGK